MNQEEIDKVIITAFRGSLIGYDTLGYDNLKASMNPRAMLKEAYRQAMKRRKIGAKT